jgi:hypothetical protein
MLAANRALEVFAPVVLLGAATIVFVVAALAKGDGRLIAFGLALTALALALQAA